MTTRGVVLKEVAPIRVAELTGTAASYGPQDIGAAVQPLWPELFRRLRAAGVMTADGTVIAYYEDPPEASDAITVHAAIPITADPQPGYDFAVVDLPAIRSAATIIHRGPMDDVVQSLWILAGWIEDHGYLPVGYQREVYLDYHPEHADRGVTEIQVTVDPG